MDEHRLNETGPLATGAKAATETYRSQASGLNTQRGRLTTTVTGSTRQNAPDLLCFSHLRWDFVFQRPQHLLTRAMRHWRVFFLEEPIWDANFRLEVTKVGDKLWRAIPFIPGHWTEAEKQAGLRKLVDSLVADHGLRRFVSWYYTPMALPFSEHLTPEVVVYDCMDELSAFRGAPPQLVIQEKRLMQMADVVLTGGQSLYEAKKDKHPNAHPFPSSIDRCHFEQARKPLPDPADQRNIKGPRMGFFGVLDERFDIELLGELATRRPDWQFVMLGPIVKIDPASLPQLPNIHYLGMKSYNELPSYVAHWDVALLPFANNESTRFISPTKTPEYLAAGRPVVSTPIRDVIRPYGDKGLVYIAETAADFERAIEASLNMTPAARQQWLSEVDAYLSTISWDQTWSKIYQLVHDQLLVKAS